MRFRPLHLVAPLAAAALLAAAPPAAAAQQLTLSAAAELQATPGGRPLAVLRAGTAVSAGAKRGEFTQVTVVGFMDSTLAGVGRDSFPVTVRPQGGAMLRRAGSADAPIVAELRGGMGMTRVGRTRGWLQVRRTGWVRSSALVTAAQARRAAATTTAAAPPAKSTPRPAPKAAPSAPPKADSRQPAAPAQGVPAQGAAAQSAAGRAPTAGSTRPEGTRPSAATEPRFASVDDPEALRTGRKTSVRTAPDGPVVVALDPGAVVQPLARERGWTRVRIEGWVPDADLLPADTALRVALSAADLRADPQGTRGKVVRWEVEAFGVERADPLRPEMAPDESYLLARGPGKENALLYLVVPTSMLSAARSLPPLTSLLITARVRSGRSEPVGIPILDIISFTRR